MSRPAGGVRPNAVVLAIAASLSACSAVCLDPDGPNSLSIEVAADANDDQATAVDLVFVTDETLAAELTKMPARDYFARRRQLQRDYPDGIQVRSWELTPGQVLREQPTDAPCGVEAALAFASYAGPGEHRQRLDGQSTVLLQLQKRDFVLAQP